MKATAQKLITAGWDRVASRGGCGQAVNTRDGGLLAKPCTKRGMWTRRRGQRPMCTEHAAWLAGVLDVPQETVADCTFACAHIH